MIVFGFGSRERRGRTNTDASVESLETKRGRRRRPWFNGEPRVKVSSQPQSPGRQQVDAACWSKSTA